MTIYRVNTWDEFKVRIVILSPETLFYLTEPHPLKEPPIGLRLTFYHGKDMYVFIDFADANALHRTGIPITNPKDKVKVEIKEEDIRRFLSNELGKVKLVSLPPFMY